MIYFPHCFKTVQAKWNEECDRIIEKYGFPLGHHNFFRNPVECQHYSRIQGLWHLLIRPKSHSKWSSYPIINRYDHWCNLHHSTHHPHCHLHFHIAQSTTTTTTNNNLSWSQNIGGNAFSQSPIPAATSDMMAVLNLEVLVQPEISVVGPTCTTVWQLFCGAGVIPDCSISLHMLLRCMRYCLRSHKRSLHLRS